MIGEREVREALKRLVAAYGLPRGRDKAAILREWCGVLRRDALAVTPTELSEAISKFIATRASDSVYGFPSPGDIKALVLASRTPEGYQMADEWEPGAFEAFIRSFDKTNRSGESFAEIKGRLARQPEEHTDGEVHDGSDDRGSGAAAAVPGHDAGT